MSEPMTDERALDVLDIAIARMRAHVDDDEYKIMQEAFHHIESRLGSAADLDEESQVVAELAERIHGVIKKSDRRILEASAQLMVSALITSNAENYTLKLGGVTHDGENHGDWTIVVQKAGDSLSTQEPPQ